MCGSGCPYLVAVPGAFAPFAVLFLYECYKTFLFTQNVFCFFYVYFFNYTFANSLCKFILKYLLKCIYYFVAVCHAVEL